MTATHIAFDDVGLRQRAERGAGYDDNVRLGGLYTDLSLLREHLAAGSSGRAQSLRTRTAGQLLAMFRYCFPLDALRRLDATGRWPGLVIGWDEPGAAYDERHLRPRPPTFGAGPGRESFWFEATVERVFRLANREAWPVHLAEGWVVVPHVEWERAPIWPTAGRGATYRTAATARAVVRRPRYRARELLSTWLGSGPQRPWEATPREVVLTEQHVYARFATGDACRLPLQSLRIRLGEADEDAIYVFGRRTQLVLPYRTDCPVRSVLDARLSRRRLALVG